jgi:Na+-transporting methylmalonyl-CoA/oxaloacetate decarboxylase beta subunit
LEKRKLTKAITIFTITCTIITIISAAFNFLLPIYLANRFLIDESNKSSIGIIGGADGPTSIYIANQSSLHLITLVPALLSILGFIYLFIAKKAERHK